MVFIQGSNDTVTLTGGTETITDTGSKNTYAVPVAGTGSLAFASNILATTDLLDLRPALSGTAWNGSAATIGSYLHVTDTAQGATLSVSAAAGGAAVTVATFAGATTASLKTVLAHSIA
jgi:hypothetical protein